MYIDVFDLAKVLFSNLVIAISLTKGVIRIYIPNLYKYIISTTRTLSYTKCTNNKLINKVETQIFECLPTTEVIIKILSFCIDF